MASIDPAGLSPASGRMAPAQVATRPNPYYFAAWRWHFYAALLVVPVLIALSLSGMAMMALHGSTNKLGRSPDVVPAAVLLPPQQVADAALAAVPGATLVQFVSPESAHRPAHVILQQGESKMVVAVDPYRAEVLGAYDKNATLYALADDFHGSLLLGTVGDRLIEAAASLTILMLVTGLYLWLPGRGIAAALLPRLSLRGRAFWKQLHGAVGTWISIVLLMFCVSGLAWSGIWGEKIVQAWSSFPLAKDAASWSSTPQTAVDAQSAAGATGAETHAALGHGISAEVPWALEQVPMPHSDGTSGIAALDGPVTLDSVVAWARENGFSGQFKVNLPRSETGVFTVGAEAMNEDSVSPSADRTVHIDQYSGRVLADIGYADYGLMGKAMAWGIGLHMGLAGTWNLVLNFALLGMILLTCVSGVVMWWKRRPAGAWRLAAPPMPTEMPMWRGALAVVLALSLAFPMAGVALLSIMAIDLLILNRWQALRRVLN